MHRERIWIGTWAAGCGLLAAGCARSLPPVTHVDHREALRLREVLHTASSAAPGEQQVAATGEGWATLRGKFLFKGTPPERPPLLINRDMEVCSPGGQPVLSEAMLVDSATRGIANVVLFLRDARRVHDSAKPGDSQVPFDQKQCVFLSHVTAVTVGQPIEVKNSDPIGHNTNIHAQRGAPFNQLIPAGGSVQYQPAREESMPISVTCNIHPWMQSYLLPRENRYVAVTAPDGTFEIANLPAGEELEFQVWHESAAGAGGALVVETPEAQQLGWSKRGRFTITLEKDQPREITIEVPPAAFHR